ncbi:hypothetical protein KKB55_02475 [Myxococcota bacterium]|nr:hypothetical protein [Myxococcota bacterium]
MALKKNLREKYSPLYFLASLGNGGLAVTFFMYLNFMIPHKQHPIVSFDTWTAYFLKAGDLQKAGVIAALLGVLFFSFRHLRVLFWNLLEYRQFRKTLAFDNLRNSNGEVTLMAIPLTLGMTVNVFFILGALSTPGIFGFIEYLFPLALLAFAGLGFYAVRVFYEFFARILTRGNFDCTKNNNLSQMLAIFAFTMLGVGFAASAAMSHVPATATIGALGAIFFNAAALLLAIVKGVLGFRAMLENGVSKEASMSLWIVIPILTLMGISLIRLNHGFHNHIHGGFGNAGYFVLTAGFLSIQLFFGGLGHTVMKRLGYYRDYVGGAIKSPGSYALICPGVALFVFSMFFLHVGLVKTELVAKFSYVYYLMLIPMIFIQFKTIATVFRLDQKLIKVEVYEDDEPSAAPSAA